MNNDIQPHNIIKETQLDYSLPVFTGSHDVKTKTIKKPLTLAYVDDESGVTAHDRNDDLTKEAMTSTERMRRYNKKHPKKVREYLKKTQDDRVARNRDRRKAVIKHGKVKMKNHDVHHPNGPHNGGARLAKKDHGRDKVNEIFKLVVENINTKNIENFVVYASRRLGILRPPKIQIIEPVENITSLGSYDLSTNIINVVIKGRLLADILRTVAHEIVHQRQNEKGLITNPAVDGATGSPIENQANIIAGILLRDYGKLNKNIFLSEGLLLEGGAAGHLAHPFEDEDLTFKDMKEMLTRGLIGGLDQEAPVTEKLDGQNIAFSVRDGQIVFARNKGHVKARGKNALDFAGIKQMFAGRGNIEKAFTGAAEDLQAAVAKLSPEQIQQMFGGGSKFMSLEVILPDTQNVIPYGKSVLVMHGGIEYDEEGNEIGRSTTDGKEFADALQAVGAEQQKTFGISGPRTITFSDADTERYQQNLEQYNARLDRAAQEFGLDETSTLAEYRLLWWRREIEKEMDRLNLNLSEEEIDGLMYRWAENDKTFGVKDIADDEAKKWFRQYEKSSLQSAQKKMIQPIESTFLQAGADSLRRVTNFLSSNNPEATAQLKKDVLDAIKAIRDSDQPDKIAKLQKELERLEAIGMDKVVPSEGVVFIYNGKPYKFTGTFAPINQITGTFKFGMAPKEVDEPTPEEPTEPPQTSPEPAKPAKPTEPTPSPEAPSKRTVAIFTGRFQPFHAGHYSIYQSLVDRFGKENVYIASSNVTDAIKSPFEFKDKKNIMTQMFDIPEDRVVQVKNPYAPVEILDKLPDNTTYVTAVSQKDADRLGGGKYFRDFDKVPDGKHRGFKDQGYFIVAPEMQLNVDGKNISGTQLRAVFGDPNITDRAKQEIFTKIYGKFNPKIFKKIVGITTDAEEARKVTDQHKDQETPAPKTGVKKMDDMQRKALQSILRQKVRNPDTDRDIYVATALKYDKTHPSRVAAEKMMRNALRGQTQEAVLTENAKDRPLNTYVYIRDYTEKELENEVGEYFDNKYTFDKFPGLAKTEEELAAMIENAPTVVLSRDELITLDNSEVGMVMKSKEPIKLLKKIATENDKDIVGLAKSFKQKEKMPLPIVIKTTKGYYLMAGNTRLSVLASFNSTMPVKVLASKDPVDVTPNKLDNLKRAKGGKTVSKKTMLNKILQMRITNPETGNQIKVDTAMDYDRLHPAHKAAMALIRQHMKDVSNRAGVPKNRTD